jgi:hypothetical protein
MSQAQAFSMVQLPCCALRSAGKLMLPLIVPCSTPTSEGKLVLLISSGAEGGGSRGGSGFQPLQMLVVLAQPVPVF